MPSIAVFCASSDGIDERYAVLAGEVGFALARRGWTLVSGGGSVSCMGAVARAARAGGAHTIGVIPRALVDLEVADHGADELVVTEDMRERKGEMDRRSDAFLTLPGGIGTLEELLEIWVSSRPGSSVSPRLRNWCGPPRSMTLCQPSSGAGLRPGSSVSLSRQRLSSLRRSRELRSAAGSQTLRGTAHQSPGTSARGTLSR